MKKDRPVLIIIPSPLILARSYEKLSRKFKALFDVQVTDLPGTGFHSSQGQVWDANAYAEYIFQNLGKEGPIIFLLGHSNSGTIAAKLSNLMQDRVAGLILADSTGMGSHSIFKTLMARGIDAIYELKFTLWAGPHLLMNVLMHPLNFFYQVYLSVKNDTSRDFKRLKVPTYLMWGKRDHTMPIKDARNLKRLIADSHLLISKTGSHDWVLTHTDEFFRSLKHQLNKIN